VRDDESFGRYVLEAYPDLVRRAILLVGDRARAEDLVQASLVAAYGRWSRVRQPDAYVRTVMVRTAIGWRKRRWNAETPTDPLPDTRSTLVDSTAGSDLSAAVRAALMELPPEQRVVVVMRYFDDCSEAEIAAALDCSPGTVKSRTSRALASIRAKGLLSEEGQFT
jgi:RNA polymerase sigma-70 factor (sigma-E family)